MSNRKKVAILNPYVATRGGGEKHMGYLCQFMEEYYNYDVDIDILVYSNEVLSPYRQLTMREKNGWMN